MLSSPAPFPFVGSYCLLDHEGETQLARIVFRRGASVGLDGRTTDNGEVVVSLPLRPDAGGNLAVDPSRLIDGTALTDAEEREYHDLDRSLRGTSGRTKSQLKQIARRDALKSRLIWSRFLDRKLRQLNPAFPRRRRAA
jgi:hypothetical protein